MSLGSVELSVNGSRAVVRRAAGLGLPLVLVPGCGGDHGALDALVQQLAGCDVVVICLPGRAGVPGPAPVTAANSAAYVAAVLLSLGVGRAVVGGHAYGGGIAIELALSHPFLVAGLVLMDTGAKLRAHPDILSGAEAAARQDEAMAANLADWRACHAFDRMREVSEISVPTLVVTGAEDVLTPPRYARYLGDHILGAEVVLVAGAGHDAPMTHPAEFAKTIRQFLDARFAS